MNTIEYFAAHLPPSSVGVSVEECEALAGPKPKEGSIANHQWHSVVDAKLRFIRARAMAEEAGRIRKDESPKDIVTMVHPLFGTPEWKSYVDKCWSKLESQIQVKMGAQSATKEPPFGAQLLADMARLAPADTDKTTDLSFSEALEAMKRGKKAKRKIWESCLMWVEDGSICMELQTGRSIRHVSVSNDEALSEDWEILPEEPK